MAKWFFDRQATLLNHKVAYEENMAGLWVHFPNLGTAIYLEKCLVHHLKHKPWLLDSAAAVIVYIGLATCMCTRI